MSWRAQGLRAWVVQRVSAVYLAVFILIAGAWLLTRLPVGYAEWRSWLAHPAVNVATAVFFAALLAHAWVGMRDILIDYVHPAALRQTLLALLALALYALGAWVLLILLSVVNL